MGQTPSKDSQYAELYSSYIKQQQNLIQQQQSQINNLYRMNLENIQQIPSNMFFQSDINNSQTPNLSQTQNLPQLTSTRTKLDPYKILGINKNFDEKTLKKAYLKAAMKSHPDRGGSPQAFQQVSIAFGVLQKKLKEKENNHSHDQLRDASRNYYNQQSNAPKVNVNMNDNFDIDVFNKIYDENKIPEVYDEGYGGWMNSNPALETEQSKMFQNGFNKDMFNSTFENYKKEQNKKNTHNSLVKYQGPEVKISLSNSDSIMTLGQGKISDFSGKSDNLNYTDYKQAFTDGSTLIDINSVDTSDRANSINGIKSQRRNISYNMSEKDQKKQALLRIEEKKAENNRLERLNRMDQRHFDNYEKIHSMLLR